MDRSSQEHGANDPWIAAHCMVDGPRVAWVCSPLESYTRTCIEMPSFGSRNTSDHNKSSCKESKHILYITYFLYWNSQTVELLSSSTILVLGFHATVNRWQREETPHATANRRWAYRKGGARTSSARERQMTAADLADGNIKETTSMNN